jgi:hypothetical protein
MTEREALRFVQDAASGEPVKRDEVISALCTLTLANRIHMQQLQGRLDALERGSNVVRVDPDA